jgi:hypothetical protein
MIPDSSALPWSLSAIEAVCVVWRSGDETSYVAVRSGRDGLDTRRYPRGRVVQGRLDRLECWPAYSYHRQDPVWNVIFLLSIFNTPPPPPEEHNSI